VRVLVVSAWEPWRTTDAAAFVLDHQLRRLADRHEITLLAAGASRAESPVPADVVDRYGGAVARWFGTPAPPILDYAHRLGWSAVHREPAHVRFVERPGLLAAYRDALAGAPDVVHLHGWGTARLSRRTGVPAVHVALDPWAANLANRRVGVAHRVLDRGQRRLVGAHERRHYPAAAAVVVVSDADAAAVRDAAPGAAVVVVPNGVEPAFVPREPAVSPPVLGFHGVFDSRANVEAARALVDGVWPRVRADVPAARVLIVGRRPPAAVRRLAGPDVEVRADVADIGAALAEMSVHVDWMTSGAGIKNKVLEAMAAARPVVTSPLGAQGIGAGPGLVVAPEIAAAAAAVTELIRDPAGLAAAGAAGRDRVLAEHSWAANAERIEQLWERAQAGTVVSR
jgi:glycosyltransferase involved in cell wall biosynthesis